MVRSTDQLNHGGLDNDPFNIQYLIYDTGQLDKTSLIIT